MWTVAFLFLVPPTQWSQWLSKLNAITYSSFVIVYPSIIIKFSLEITYLVETHSSALNIRLMWRCKQYEALTTAGDEAGDWGGVW